MVKNKQKLNRSAFTMIELIFAIVVIAISVMSLPMMTRVTTQGMENNLVQEIIFASVAEINFATTYVWDDDSLSDDIDELSKVLNTTAAGSTCTITGTNPPRRVGHINRECLSDTSTTMHNTQHADAVFQISAIDKNIHSAENIYVDNDDVDVNASSSISGYKTMYQSTLAVKLGNNADLQFGAEADNINIREITVVVVDKDGNDITRLRTYSANVGEVAYASKDL